MNLRKNLEGYNIQKLSKTYMWNPLLFLASIKQSANIFNKSEEIPQECNFAINKSCLKAFVRSVRKVAKAPSISSTLT